MNETVRIFLDILRSALGGERPRRWEQLSLSQWQTLFHLAELHNVLPLFYESVYDQPSLADAQPLLADMKQRMRRQVIRQTLRTRDFLTLNQRLLEAGVTPLVVKGLVCRQLYPQPDHRPSSDEDVLILPEQFDRCHQVLTAFGLAAEGGFDHYEIPYRKEGSSLYIELHKSLFPPENDAYGHMNRFFAHVHDRAVSIQIQGQQVCTLGHTDHLLFLICHAFKHFLHSGFGIRQVCDIVLYANAYGREVDWHRILEDCRTIRAEKFAAAIFAIGRNYLVFDPRQAAWPDCWQQLEVDEVPMLMDLLMGGLYGDSSMSRKHSSSITLDAVAAQKAGKQAKSGLVVSVFPPAVKLEGRYPYLKKHPYLLPLAWCSRLWSYGREIRGDRNNRAADALKIGSQRVELLRLYDIIE